MIRDFLCKTHPANLAIGSIVILFYAFAIFRLGFVEVVVTLGLLGVLLGVLFGLGYVLYRGIKWAQSYCEDTEA